MKNIILVIAMLAGIVLLGILNVVALRNLLVP
jgi:hypothetical protein